MRTDDTVQELYTSSTQKTNRYKPFLVRLDTDLMVVAKNTQRRRNFFFSSYQESKFSQWNVLLISENIYLECI